MRKTLINVWIILLLLTLFAYLLGYLKLISSALVGVLFITTFIKGQLVIDYFMGLREVQSRYRFIPTIWLGVVISLLGLAYYLPPTV